MRRLNIEQEADRVYVYNIHCMRCGHFTLRRSFGALKCDTCRNWQAENPYANIEDLRDHTDVPFGQKIPRRLRFVPRARRRRHRGFYVLGTAAVLAAIFVWLS